MSVFTDVFGGTTIYPSDVSYLSLALTADVTLQWPLEASTGNDIAARIIDITPTGPFDITMPPADQTGVGQTTLFNNLGPSTVTVLDADGDTLISLPEGTQWQLYLTDNTTSAGTWRVFQYGAATASAQASGLAGFGLLAQGSLLSQNYPTTSFNANYTLGVADRAATYVWEGASGTLTFLASATAGNGYFVSVRNGGTGDLVLDPAGSETINGASTLTLNPGDSAVVICGGTAWYTVGFGQDAVFAFDYTSIDLTGETTSYTLSGAELNRISYSFIGTLTTNMEIVVPATTQQYWVSNDTSGAFDLSVRAPDQATGVTVVQGGSAIMYCNGTDVVPATTGGVASPLAVADGGTGSTTAGGALINLGGTTTGIAVFTAVSAATARAALGLSLPLAVASGGTGVTTSTGSGNTVLSTSPTLVTPLLGTPTSGNLSNCTGVSLTAGVSGTLPFANGGTGLTTGTTSIVQSTPTTIFAHGNNSWLVTAYSAATGYSVTGIVTATTGGPNIANLAQYPSSASAFSISGANVQLTFGILATYNAIWSAIRIG